jgi:hypothetical protein
VIHLKDFEGGELCLIEILAFKFVIRIQVHRIERDFFQHVHTSLPTIGSLLVQEAPTNNFRKN